MTALAHPAPAAPIWVAAGTTAAAAVRDAGLPGRGAPDAIVVVRDAEGKLRDLSWIPAQDAEVTPVAANTDDGRSVIRHSTAHVLAQAVQDMFPNAKLGIGPPITDGFYYDFDVADPFTPEDLEALEKRMRQILKAGQLFSRRVYESKEQAREELAKEPYKLELIDSKSGDPDVMEVGGDELTAYDNLNPRTRERVWGDLCRGPHIPTTKHIPAFKLTRSSAAYWRGDQNNASLQRIYGTAWESQEALDHHLQLLEEAQRRDHRKLGVELDLFSFPDEIGSGLAGFPPQGRDRARRARGLLATETCPRRVTSSSTPRTSPRRNCSKRPATWTGTPISQYPPMHLDAEFNDDGTVRKPGQDYYLKPMNCPMHHLIYRARGRSYRELPLRLFEFGTVYRYEKSGVVHGLTRVRGYDPGRRTYLLHTRADARRAGLAAALRPRPAGRLRARRTSTWSCRPRIRTSTWAPRRFGRRRPTCCARSPKPPACTWFPTRAARRSTARRSRCRSRMRWAEAGRCRPSSSTSTCPSGSSWNTPPLTVRGSGRCSSTARCSGRSSGFSASSPSTMPARFRHGWRPFRWSASRLPMITSPTWKTLPRS